MELPLVHEVLARRGKCLVRVSGRCADDRRSEGSGGVRWPEVRFRHEAWYTTEKSGKGFTYSRADGSRLTEADVLRRIKSLAIPPPGPTSGSARLRTVTSRPRAAMPRGASNIATMGFFVRSARAPNTNVVEFAEALPAIRAQVRQHMALPGLPREKVLATVVHLLETTLIRVGNDDYARQNNSYGLTTLKTRHVAVNGNEVRFRFTGKSGKQWSLRVKDRRIAKIIKACQDLPGQELLQYLDDEGKPQDVTSTDVNAYLKQITGKNITAKDFRTWAGTVLAAMALNELKSFDSAAQAKLNLRTAIENVASRLGNTATICRKCYVHPEILTSYLDGNLILEIKSAVESELREDLDRLKPEEAWATRARALARCAATFPAQDPSSRPRCLEQTRRRA